jgi:ketosteroid isomerase-like protein
VSEYAALHKRLEAGICEELCRLYGPLSNQILPFFVGNRDYLSRANITAPPARCGPVEKNAMEKANVLKTIDIMTTSFAAGDIRGVLATYEREATVVARPGQPVTGQDALNAMFEQFVASGVNFEYGPHDVILCGDIALHLMQWTAPSPQGNQSALSVAVLRKQIGGGWKMVIDHPFGDAVMHA